MRTRRLLLLSVLLVLLAGLALVAGRARAPSPGAPPAPLPERIARAAEPELPEPDVLPGPRATADVECEIEGLDEAPLGVELFEHDEETMAPIARIRAKWVDGWITFVPRRAEGLGVVSIYGYAPAALGWVDGACLAPVRLTPLPAATLRGTVDGLDGREAHVLVQGCTDRVLSFPVRADGRFEAVIHPTEDGASCELSVSWMFGTRREEGESRTVSTRWGDEIELSLSLPPAPGVGWDLLATEDGFRVAEVVAGSPAARAGIGIADRIVAVGGEPALGFDVEDLDDLDLPVVITRSRDGRLAEVVLRP